MSEARKFDVQERALAEESTALSIMSGLAIRYHHVLEVQFNQMERLASIVNDPNAERLKSKILPRMQQAIAAEAPLAFSLQPSNMATGINMMKIDPSTGSEIVFSDTQVGLMGGLAKDGRPTSEFTPEDLALAVQRLREQKQAGLVYGMSTSAFLVDY